MTIKCTCLYCDHKWTAYGEWDIRECARCFSKKPKVERINDKDKIDYYQGSPPFPEKPKVSENDPELFWS